MSRHSIVASLLLAASFSRGAELKQETLNAWDRYLAEANAGMQERAHGHFLWVDEAADRLARVRAGEVVVSPLDHTPRAVPSGLIHHWIGAAFIPNARIDDVMSVVRDYDRYTQFYKPSVIDAKTLSRAGSEDRFSVVIVDPGMFMKRALDSEYQSRFAQVEPGKWFSVARTMRVQEVADDRLIPDGEGSGYIWRLCTMSRYQERDNGVYIETEALALSRPIPVTLHWVVEPIVKRVSRASLTKSLEQTRDATGAVIKSESGLSASRRSVTRHGLANE